MNIEIYNLLRDQCIRHNLQLDEMLIKHGVTNTNYELVLPCGNGGDYEYEMDAHRWRRYCEMHDFKISLFPHADGDKIVMFFESDDERVRFMMYGVWYAPI